MKTALLFMTPRSLPKSFTSGLAPISHRELAAGEHRGPNAAFPVLYRFTLIFLSRIKVPALLELQ